MKAIRIDPTDRTVTASSTLTATRASARPLRQDNHNTFCLAGYFRKDTVYVNDEGLYLFDTFFELEGCGQGLFAGPGLIVGTEIGDTDKTRPPKSSVEEVTSKITWHDRVSARDRSKELGI